MERQQQQAQQQMSSSSPLEQSQVQISHQTSEVNQNLVSEVDDILAEIDGLLEENAEDFVKGFVQKGGE
ncbi:ubiquitin-like protein Pup [Rothia endophytica]|uniref:ubiquitin-like protein Pup n=1 Tax=Rothia endophytica TaxID=1324766 RepID=UPI001F013A04|nr:ubiquitin-like protein Pup [Rothia endophytica]